MSSSDHKIIYKIINIECSRTFNFFNEAIFNQLIVRQISKAVEQYGERKKI